MTFSKNTAFASFEKRIYLSSPTMHGEELRYMQEAFETNWMSTVGANIDEVERLVCEKVGCKYAVALSSGTAALHLVMKLAGITRGTPVFSSDMTFAATTNPIAYEGGEQIFIDTERDTWNMSPEALEKAFALYPQVKHVVVANLYGTPGKLDELCGIAHRHGAIVIEDAAESFGASYKGKQTGLFGDIGVISFNGNKIITGSCGGALLTNDAAQVEKARKWSTQSRENAPWYQHEEMGYNYRMSNVVTGVIRGQMPHLEEHIAQKKTIYERYCQGFAGLPAQMNPHENCAQSRTGTKATYTPEKGKTCPRKSWKRLRHTMRRDAQFGSRCICSRFIKTAHLFPAAMMSAQIFSAADSACRATIS